MEGYTRFTHLSCDNLDAAKLLGALCGGIRLSKSDNYALKTAERRAHYVGFTVSAASKSLVLGLAEGQLLLLANEGETNAFTAKNLSGDTGISLAAGKVALVVGRKSANASKIFILN